MVGGLRLAGSYRTPTLGVYEVAEQAFYMGQGLLMPPTVEGWHEAEEWIDSGALVERVNFVSQQLRDVDQGGVRSIIDRLSRLDGGTLSPEELVDGCLDLLGPVEADEATRQGLVDYVRQGGDGPPARRRGRRQLRATRRRGPRPHSGDARVPTGLADVS